MTLCCQRHNLCGIAEAYYREIPKEIATRGNLLIDSGLRRVVREFNEVMNVE